MLEAAQYDDNTFCTLTYSDENIPLDQSVSPRELQLFMKRLRKTSPKIRYFACGEYGDTTMRPHYHLALFNHPNCERGQTRLSKTFKPCCTICDNIRNAWGKGEIFLGQLEPKSMAYVAGYVVKKMTKDDDPRLEGRLPEFARMSLRPGIGYGMMHELASVLLSHKLDEKMIDVPLTLQHGTKQLPLGRYLRRKLRKMIGKDENTPQASLDAQKEKLQTLRTNAFNNSRSFRSEVVKETQGQRIKIHANSHRTRKRGHL